VRRHFAYLRDLGSWNLRAAAAFLLAILTFAIPALAQSGTEQSLRDGYKGKTFVLRGFYSGDRLRYDDSGTVSGGAVSGDWTSDGFIQVDEIRSTRHGLVIDAHRLLVMQFEGKEFQFLTASKPGDKQEKHKLGIEVDFDPAIGPQGTGSVLSKIFLTSQDNFAGLVSDYWKPCVREAAAGSNQHFRFSPELLSVPGVAVSEPGDNNAGSDTSGSRVLNCNAPATSRRGVYPRVIYQVSPEFSEQARRAKIQGDVVLLLVVNEQGLPEHIRITQPFGYGLDEQALNCVQKWRFKPAEQDGQPIPTQIAVEVNFHLY
jgi:TonB family protein